MRTIIPLRIWAGSASVACGLVGGDSRQHDQTENRLAKPLEQSHRRQAFGFVAARVDVASHPGNA